MARILFSEQADIDLLEVWLYIAEDNIESADRFVSEIRDKCRLLAGSPEMGKARDEICEGIRSFPVGNHLIFYRIGNKAIEVARILSGARDILSLFNQ